jgi:hypothetical protein
MPLGENRCADDIEIIVFQRAYLVLVKVQFLGDVDERNLQFTTSFAQPLAADRAL